MRSILSLALAICIAGYVPLPPRRGDGSPVKYVPYVKAQHHRR